VALLRLVLFDSISVNVSHQTGELRFPPTSISLPLTGAAIDVLEPDPLLPDGASLAAVVPLCT
jgi:hypothetical protein